MEQTLFNSSIQKWIFFTFINTAIFLHFRISVYEVHCLCHNYWPSKITWGKLLSIVGDYDQFTFFIYFKQYLQQLGLRGSLQRRGKRLSWWNIPHMISCLPIWTCLIILPKNKNIFQSWFIDGDNVLSHTSLPKHRQNATCFHLSCWWSRLLLDNYMLILGWAQSPYYWDY